MNASEFLEKRKSTRDFKNKKLESQDVRKIQGILDDANEKSKRHNVSYILLENGKDVFQKLDGLAGYSGYMIEAPAYIAMQLEHTEEESYIFGSFYFEYLVTKLHEMGLGTCWITAGNLCDAKVKDVFAQAHGKIEFLLAIGYLPMSFSFGKQVFSSRIGVEEFVFIDDFDHPAEISQLQNYGLDEIFGSVRFAPSTKNEQPWRFVVDSKEIKLYIENYQGIANLVDAGIIMYYYVGLAAQMGIDALWYADGGEDIGNKKYIARVNY